jgi:hypothetical protein
MKKTEATVTVCTEVPQIELFKQRNSLCQVFEARI